MGSKEWTQASSLETFDGFRIEAAKSASKHLQSSHSLFLGTQLREQRNIYQVGPTFVSEDQRTHMMGRYDLDGSINGRFLHKVSEDVEVKASAMSSLKDEHKNVYEFSLEKSGRDWASTAKLGWQGTWLLNGSFAQEITRNLTLGTDLMWLSVNGVSIGQVAARYTVGRDVWNAALTRSPNFKAPTPMAGPVNSLKFSFARKISGRLLLGSEAEFALEDLSSSMKVAYEYTFRHARVQGSIDSAGKVACFVQDLMGFGFSGSVDFLKDDYKFGFLFHIVPQPEEGQKK